MSKTVLLDTSFLITLYEYGRKLLEAGEIECRLIRLSDGFDVALLNPDRQRELPESEA